MTTIDLIKKVTALRDEAITSMHGNPPVSKWLNFGGQVIAYNKCLDLLKETELKTGG